jgi:FkbM family methyltransferase
MKQTLKSLLLATHAYRPIRQLRQMSPAARRQFEGIRRLYSLCVRPGDLCFDIGANIGSRAAVMLGLGARVVAGEPNPPVFRELTAYLSSNPRFYPVQSAIGSSPGQARLRIAKCSGLSTLNPGWYGGMLETVAEVSVEVTTLDALIAPMGCRSFSRSTWKGMSGKP